MTNDQTRTQAMINTLVAQRDDALNRLPMMAGEIAALQEQLKAAQARIAELEAEADAALHDRAAA